MASAPSIDAMALRRSWLSEPAGSWTGVPAMGPAHVEAAGTAVALEFSLAFSSASRAWHTTSRTRRPPVPAYGDHNVLMDLHASSLHLGRGLHLDQLGRTGALHGASTSPSARAAALSLGVPTHRLRSSLSTRSTALLSMPATSTPHGSRLHAQERADLEVLRSSTALLRGCSPSAEDGLDRRSRQVRPKPSRRELLRCLRVPYTSLAHVEAWFAWGTRLGRVV